jgi:hypothetical protein
MRSESPEEGSRFRLRTSRFGLSTWLPTSDFIFSTSDFILQTSDFQRQFGEVAEWFKAAVLKTVEVERLPGVRIPSSPPASSSPARAPQAQANDQEGSVGRPRSVGGRISELVQTRAEAEADAVQDEDGDRRAAGCHIGSPAAGERESQQPKHEHGSDEREPFLTMGARKFCLPAARGMANVFVESPATSFRSSPSERNPRAISQIPLKRFEHVRPVRLIRRGNDDHQ